MQIRCIRCNKVIAASVFPIEVPLRVVDSSKKKDEKGIEVKCRYCKTFNLIVV
jgi:phage FluMu protein Com